MRGTSSPENWSSTRPYSPAVIAGEWVYVSGHVPVDKEGVTSGANVTEQTRQVLENLERTLESAGVSRRDVVSTTVYLTDISDIDAVDAVYREFFLGSGSVFPSRTTVGIGALGRPDFRVEISAVAHSGAHGGDL